VEARHVRIHVESLAVCLAFCAVVACIREHADGKQRDRLEFFVGEREAIMREKVVADLLDDVLERDEACLILFQALLQGGNRFLDGWLLLACGSLLCLGANKAIGENGNEQVKSFLPPLRRSFPL